MQFVQLWIDGMQRMTPFVLGMPLLLIPFIIVEQLRPAERRPRAREYAFNVVLGITTAYITFPLSLAVGMASSLLRSWLPWAPPAISLDIVAALPVIGSALQIVVMILVSFFLHDLWFYWAHRLEHRIPFLWEFHKVHHSDELLNAATFARDHFLQAVWVGLWPAFTIGILFDLSPFEGGVAGLTSALALTLLSMFYHSAIRVQLPWLDRVIVTPQVHRIHHSVDPAHHNCNFADALPIFDIVFGTYRRPERGHFPSTGLGPAHQTPSSLWRAQFEPVAVVVRKWFAKHADEALQIS